MTQQLRRLRLVRPTFQILFTGLVALGVCVFSALSAPPLHAGDLAEGHLLVGDQKLGLSGTCARGMTHLDPETGEQYPLTVRSLTSGATALANGDIITWLTSGGTNELIRITPSSGAHRLSTTEDNDFTAPADITEDATGNYIIANDDAVGRLETLTGIFEILASGGDLIDPSGLVIAPNGDIFIADPGAGAVFRFQSTTGTAPFAAGDMISQPRALAWAADGDLLVADGNTIVRVDPVSAAQSAFAAPVDGIPGTILDITVNAGGDVFVLQDRPRCTGVSFSRAIKRIPEVGDPTPLLCVNNQDEPINTITTISAEIGGNDLIVLGQHDNDGAGNADAVWRLDTSDLTIELISIRPPSGAFAFDPAGNFYVAVETQDAIFKVDPKVGVSQSIASGGLLNDPQDLVASDDGAFLFVLDKESIVRVNPITGAQAEIYDGAAFVDPNHIRKDTAGNFVIADLFSEELIFINSTTFAESTLGGGDLFRIVDVADTGNGELVVIDVGPNAPIRINPVTEDQNLVGDAGYFSPSSPSSMLPEADGKILVAVGGASAPGLLRIDPSDASQTVVSEMPVCIGTDMEHVVLAEPTLPCGDPVDPGTVVYGTPSQTGPRVIAASDALFILRASVGLGSCELCVCDVNGSGSVTAPDALLLLQFSVGGNVQLACPAC